MDSLTTYVPTWNYGLRLEKFGDIDGALWVIQNDDPHMRLHAPAAAYFLRGVYEEEQGRVDAAREFYQTAAHEGDALGAFAYTRLNRTRVH